MPCEKVGYAVDCGIKLSQWFSRETVIGGNSRKCFTALLNPRDEYDRYTSSDYRCLKLELDSKFCYVADRTLYETGQSYPQVMELYKSSIVPIKKYIFGDYRFPEVLITTTVLGEHITVIGKMLDSPVLYENSQELYFNNLMGQLKEKSNYLDDTLLYLYFNWLCELGKAECTAQCDGAYAVFRVKGEQRVYTFRAPGRV
jgi:hypothetical protein